MMYDVVYGRAGTCYLVCQAVEEVVRQTNKICNEGHKGKKGWKPQGGISIAANEGYVFASQAIVCYEDDETDKSKEFNVRLL